MLARTLGLLSLLAAEAAAITGLHALGSLPWLALPADDITQWLATTAPPDVVAAGLRLAALACAYWLALSTVGYTLARVSRVPAAVRGVEWVTLPVVRRIADRAVAVVLAASSVVGGSAGPAVAGEPVTVEGAGPGTPAEVELPPALRSPEALPGSSEGEEKRAPQRPADTPSDPEPTEEVHVVERGEHLWAIAEADLAARLGREPGDLTPVDVAPHWRRVVADNVERLRSGDADVIYPGEAIELPPDSGGVAPPEAPAES